MIVGWGGDAGEPSAVYCTGMFLVFPFLRRSLEEQCLHAVDLVAGAMADCGPRRFFLAMLYRPARSAEKPAGILAPRVFRRLPALVFVCLGSVTISLFAFGARNPLCGHSKLCSRNSVFFPIPQLPELPKSASSFPARRVLSASPACVYPPRLAEPICCAARSPSLSGCSTRLMTITTGTYTTRSSSRLLLRRTGRRWRTSGWPRRSTSWTWTTRGTSRGIT